MNTIEEQRALEALYTTGLWLIDQNRLNDAARVFQAMMVCQPTDERGWLALGTCHEKMDNVKVAYSIFEAGRHAASPSARCEIARARAARALGNEDLALEAYDAAIAAAEAADDEQLQSLATMEREQDHVRI